MNSFLAKIKNLDYKQFALHHGEKIGMAVVGLVVLASLFLTTWASEYKGDPAGMIDLAEKVESQLKGNRWTDEKKKDFLPHLTADGELQKVTQELIVADYNWPIPPSHKLYKSSQPADEAEWLSVAGLQVHFGQMPMGVIPPPPAELTADDAKAKPAKADKKKNKSEELTLVPVAPPTAGPGAGAAGAMAASNSASEKASGRRFNVLVGVVEVKRQHNLLMQKLHVELSQAAGRLKYVGFSVQRQRAVPGENPWTGPWRDLNTDASMDVLGEASDFDQELVMAKFTNVEFTSPLPHRLDEDWDPNMVVHRRIPTLTEDEQEAERIKTEAAHSALEGAEDSDDGESRKRGGFSRIQKDANRMRQRASSTDEGRSKMKEYETSMRKEMGIGMGMGAGKGPPAGRPNAAGMGYGTGNTMGMGGAGSGAGGDAGSDLLLFRYFDFDVEPGECYRYRVQLVVLNPSFQQSFVSAPAVAEDETRVTPWSAPSPPVVVASDIDYALTKVPVQRNGRQDGADLNVVQFDTNFGTFIMDTFKVFFGSTVGHPKWMSLHLDVAAETFKEEPVTFSSRDVLLDSAGISNLSNALEDLELTDPKKIKRLTKEGELDMAVTLNRFGELVELDADSEDELSAAKREVDEQREPYKDIKETDRDRKKKAKAAKEAEDSLDQAVNSKNGKDKKKSGKKKKKKKKDKKGSNPLKGGSGASMPGMPGGMAMPPGR